MLRQKTSFFGPSEGQDVLLPLPYKINRKITLNEWNEDWMKNRTEIEQHMPLLKRAFCHQVLVPRTDPSRADDIDHHSLWKWHIDRLYNKCFLKTLFFKTVQFFYTFLRGNKESFRFTENFHYLKLYVRENLCFFIENVMFLIEFY